MAVSAMNEFKFKSMKEEFEENYKAVKMPAANRKGYRMEYVYIGQWVGWKESSAHVRKTKITAGICCALSLLLYLCAATFGSPVNYGRLVSMTGLLALAPFIFVVFGVFQFCLSKEKMTKDTFRDISAKLKVAPVIYAFLMIICGTACMIEVFRSGYEPLHLLIGAGYIVSAAAQIVLFVRFSGLHRKIYEK